jgi:hypothetical protein
MTYENESKRQFSSRVTVNELNLILPPLLENFACMHVFTQLKLMHCLKMTFFNHLFIWQGRAGWEVIDRVEWLNLLTHLYLFINNAGFALTFLSSNESCFIFSKQIDLVNLLTRSSLFHFIIFIPRFYVLFWIIYLPLVSVYNIALLTYFHTYL